MTTYILAGGNDRLHDVYGPQLAAEVHKHIAEPIRLLSCFFADHESRWQNKALFWEEWFKDNFGGHLQYTVASLEEFPAQVKAANVVYLHGGGSNELILERMQAFPDIAKLFESKLVVGSSAGANYLSRKFWTRSKRQVMNGVGLVPYGVMVHYGSVDGGFGRGVVDWPQAEQAVRDAIGQDTKLLKLREGEFTVVEA